MAKNKTKILYICSAGHSGSTLLDLLLGGHPDIMSMGEIVHLPKNIALNTECTCGSSVRDCVFWKGVISQLNEANGCDYFSAPYRLNLGYIKSVTVRDTAHQNRRYDSKWRALSGLFLLNYALGIKVMPSIIYKEVVESAKTSMQLYQAISKISGSSVLVDSSKSYMRALSLYEQDSDNVRVLLLTRDARGVQYSNIKRGRSGSDALLSWKKHYSRAASTLLNTIGDKNWLHIKYEDLVRDPPSILQEICEFSGIFYTDEMLDMSKKERHLTNGNNMRFVKADEIRLDESWKQGLSTGDLLDYKNIAEKLNRSFGYQ